MTRIDTIAAAARPAGVDDAAGAALRIAIRAPTPVRAYVVRLAERLVASGHAVRIEPGASASPRALDWLLTFETIAFRARTQAFAMAPQPSLTGFSGEGDLILDLAGDAPPGPTATMRISFDDVAGETGLVAALLDRTAPHLRIDGTLAGGSFRTLAQARLAIEHPDILARALDAAAARLVTLLLGAIATRSAEPAARLFEPPGSVRAVASPRSALAFGGRALGDKLMARLSKLVRHPDHWHVALRTLGGDGGVMETLDWSGGRWRLLPDDGRRYYADPFLFEWKGRRWLFCEEYPYATNRGILSVAEIGADGSAGTPRPFLDTGAHASWPAVFVHEGGVYMIPETAAAGRVELWRATDFPMGWELDRVLIEGVRAHDPQLHLGANGASLLATLDADGGSSWDALGLFHAPGLFGPWKPFAHNPVLVDASCARGAGPLVRRGDALWRAAQDCSTGYGGGLALCRITRLDEKGFAQDVVARLGPPPAFGARGVHTLARLGGLEAIDLRFPSRVRRTGAA